MNVSTRGRSIRLILTLILTGFLFSSCTGLIGHGVLNWSVPEYGLAAGDIVPVFIQSNIGKVYVVGVGKGFHKRIELPLWQLTLYKSKSKARAAASALAEYRYAYATVKLDGLPIRAQPENTARQVYRLKQDQKIKILKKGEGTPVLAGNSPLDGDWYEVMTDDGATGWCFSWNLSLFDEREAGSGAVVVTSVGPDTSLEDFLARTWYPDSWRMMIESNRIDLDKINPMWGFFPGKDSGIARIVSSDGIVTFPFTKIDSTGNGLFTFEGSSLTVQVKKADSILVQYTDANGMPQASYFASLATSPDDLIQAEKDRRASILSAIRKAGPRFSSGNYGVLQFLGGGKFIWSGWNLLSPSVIPSNAGSGGSVEVRCFLDSSISSAADGVLSFRFDATTNWIHFLYKLTPDGLKLEQVSESGIKDAVVTTRNLTPTVIFFKPEHAARDGQ